MSGLHITRPRPDDVPELGAFHAGSAVVDITPHAGLGLAGYSWGGPAGEGCRGRLFARAVVFDDGRRGRIALVSADLHSGARYVNERAASTLSDVSLSVDRVVMLGTHCHTGHGNFYGDSFYDRMATDQGDFDQRLADWTAGRVTHAVREACTDLHAATLHVTTIRVPDVTRNRAMLALQHDPEWTKVPLPNKPHLIGWADPKDPHAEKDRYRAVDDRLTVWAAVPKASNRTAAVFALFACHGTTLGHSQNLFDPDWAGRAVLAAERELGSGEGRWKHATIALANGAAGDVNALAYEGREQGPDLADAVGAKMGHELALAVKQAAQLADVSGTISSRFAEHPIGEATVLARKWAVGHTIIGGAEDGRSKHFTPEMAKGMSHPGHPVFKDDPAQVPKLPLLKGSALAKILEEFLLLHPPRVLTLRVITLGSSVLLTVPFEPTVVASWRIELAVRKAMIVKDDDTVRVAGYAGAFNGYLTTPEEYRVQLYEGAHTHWGINSEPYVTDRCAALAAAPPPGPATGEAEFPDVFRDPNSWNRFVEGKPRDLAEWLQPSADLASPGAQISARFVVWSSPPPVFAGDAWVTLDKRVDGRWETQEVNGIPCSDRTGFITIDEGRPNRGVPGDPRRTTGRDFRASFDPSLLGPRLTGCFLRLHFESGNPLAIPIR